jgi:hypothetical protein
MDLVGALYFLGVGVVCSVSAWWSEASRMGNVDLQCVALALDFVFVRYCLSF